MRYRWNDAARRLTDEQGVTVLLPFLGGREQFDRWVQKGYGFDMAVARRASFLELLDARDAAHPASVTINTYIAQEVDWARRSGIAAEDADYWRIAASAKHLWL